MDKQAIINALRNYAQATSNEITNMVAGPVDLINAGLEKIGLGSQEPVGGSAWMQRQGLTAPVPEGWAKTLGEATGFVLPFAGMKAKEIAQALRKGGENLAKSVGAGGVGGGQRGVLYNPTGKTRQQTREIIQNDAEELKNILESQGLRATVEHSGSIAGPSSYVSVMHPETGASLKYPIRLSDHSKGPFQSQLIYGNYTKEEFPELLKKIDVDLSTSKPVLYLQNEIKEKAFNAAKNTYPDLPNKKLWKIAEKEAENFIETQSIFPQPIVKALRNGN